MERKKEEGLTLSTWALQGTGELFTVGKLAFAGFLLALTPGGLNTETGQGPTALPGPPWHGSS